MENIYESFGAVVRSLRSAAGMTQEQLAQALTHQGWAARQNTVAKLENGLRPTTIAELYAIAAVFDMKPQDLYALVKPPEDEAAKAALKQSLALKRAQYKTALSEHDAAQFEAIRLMRRIEELKEAITELEDQVGEHSEEG